MQFLCQIYCVWVEGGSGEVKENSVFGGIHEVSDIEQLKGRYT